MQIKKLLWVAGIGAAAFASARAMEESLKSDASGRIAIVGGGSAGIPVAARLGRRLRHPDVILIEPSDTHYYQPGLTLVSSGVFPKEHFIRQEENLIPTGVGWVKDKVSGFYPEDNKLVTEGGSEIGYDYLVVCPEHQLNYDQIEGIEGHVGHNGLYSNYTPEGAEATWQGIRDFQEGTALFVEPAGPIKCDGAPQEIAYMAESHWRRAGMDERVNEIFASGKPSLFSVPLYRKALTGVMERKGIELRFNHNLFSVDPEKKEATFTITDNGETTLDTISYDLLHFCPPQGAPDFIKQSPLANEAGYVDVDKHTMQHNTYPNIFSLGDASSLPTSKTVVAIGKQAPILVHNLIRLMEGANLSEDSRDYHGYSSCPLVTDYERTMLAEFDYSLKPTPTFPPWEHDPTRETYPNWLLKTHGLPNMYWYGMLRGF